jgi:hypothetical protein
MHRKVGAVPKLWNGFETVALLSLEDEALKWV